MQPCPIRRQIPADSFRTQSIVVHATDRLGAHLHMPTDWRAPVASVQRRGRAGAKDAYAKDGPLSRKGEVSSACDRKHRAAQV